MITAEQIRGVYRRMANGSSDDDNYGNAEALKKKMACLRRERQPFYLNSEEFEEILAWKLRGQLGRQRGLRAINTDEIVRKVTGIALTIIHESEDYELDLRMGILCTLRGVGIPVASAVLALVYPEKYAVIDFRAWRQVFGEKRYSFTLGDYKAYMREIRRLATELSLPVQEVDAAIWEHDRLQNGRL